MRAFLFLVLTLLLPCAHAAGELGVGFMIGQPIGVTAKKWLKSTQAIDAGAGRTIGRDPHFNLHSDYLWHKTDALYFQDDTPLDFYFGAGARLGFDDEIELGARLPVGLAHFFNDRGAEAFCEIAPVMVLLPDTNLEGDVLLGLRIYF
jgi:hypothetical protein